MTTLVIEGDGNITKGKVKQRRAILTFLTLSSILLASCAQGSSGGKAEEWEAPARATRIGNPVAADQKSIAAGKATFQGQCVACHGSKGKGNGPAAIALERRPSDLSMPMMWEHSDGALFWKITEGRRPMPSFEKLLTEHERWQIVNYIRTLAPQPDRGGMSREPRNGAKTEHMH